MEYKSIPNNSIEEMLSHYLNRFSRKDMQIIMIGANNGENNDFLIKYLSEPRFHGVLVEPIPYLFKQLESKFSANKNLHFENAAIYKKNCKKKIYRLKNDVGLPVWTEGLGSFNKQTILSHKNQIEGIEDYIVEEKVACVTFDSLLKKYSVSEINILQIDVEGYDYELVNFINFDNFKPNIIIVEYLHLTTYQYYSLINLFCEKNYKVTRSYNSFDLFAINREIL